MMTVESASATFPSTELIEAFGGDPVPLKVDVASGPNWLDSVTLPEV